MPAQRKRVAKKKPVKRRKRTVKDPFLTKLDYWAIACKEIYETCRRNGMDEGTALAFAMDRSSWPDWVVDKDDPIRKIDLDEEEDE